MLTVATTVTRYGASPADWFQWDLELGLGTHLLPILANPKAPISPKSSIREAGKLPSIYNASRQLVGLGGWSQLEITPQHLKTWAAEPDYGIGLRLGHILADGYAVVAIDVDVLIPERAAAVEVMLEHLGAPIRRRQDSSKFLILVRIPAEIGKRRFKVKGGFIELLAKGQQCVIAGRHPGGQFYAWDGGLPDAIPAVDMESLEGVWSKLIETFAIEDATSEQASTKHQVLKDAIHADPFVQHLIATEHVHQIDRSTGRVDIQCFSEHDGGAGSISSTSYFPAHTGGYASGTFKCQHASCRSHQMTQAQIKSEYGFSEGFGFDDLDAIDNMTGSASLADLTGEKSSAEETGRRPFVSLDELGQRPRDGYHIKKVIPKSVVGVMYGGSGTGKSFWAADMMFAIARGVEWQGHRVTKGRVAYICAEGKGGFYGRAKAYCERHGIEMSELQNIRTYDIKPNLLKESDAARLAEDIVADGGADIIVVDTLAQVTPGGNENSSEDMSLALDHCDRLHAYTKATVMLVHHSGKDISKGARGWSGLKGACDFELEVTRDGHNRAGRVSKAKDGSEGEEFHFVLNEVAIGIDEDGDTVTSCSVEYVEAPAALHGGAPKGQWAILMWKIAQRDTLIGESLSREYLIAKFKDMVKAPSGLTSNGNPKKDNRWRDADRGLASLVETGHLTFDGAHYFITQLAQGNA